MAYLHYDAFECFVHSQHRTNTHMPIFSHLPEFSGDLCSMDNPLLRPSTPLLRSRRIEVPCSSQLRQRHVDRRTVDSNHRGPVMKWYVRFGLPVLFWFG